jgi:DNA-directed RNA polymerase subunit M/transcription elongation factor TFIIS
MKFCVKCNNLYYIAVSEKNENQLTYCCRNCGYEELHQTDNFCGLKTDSTYGDQIYKYTLNEYTVNDPTLPRIYNTECINAECPTHGKKSPTEIIYMRYDDANLKYAYICTTCKTAWKVG